MSVENLRGWIVSAWIDDKWVSARVVTHIRNDSWLVVGGGLPSRCFRADTGDRRAVVPRWRLRLITPPTKAVPVVRPKPRSTARDRVVCPTCGCVKPLRMDGKIYAHFCQGVYRGAGVSYY